MSSAEDTAAPDIVIFGAAGDLSCRKLLPALYMAHMHSRLEPGTRILAIGRQAWSRQQYLDFIDARSPAFIEPAAMDASVWGAFLARLDYIGLDESREHLLFYASSPDAMRDLRVPMATLRRYGSMSVCSDLTDAHLYIFSRYARAHTHPSVLVQ